MGEIHNNGWWIWTKANVKCVAALNDVNIVYVLETACLICGSSWEQVSSQNFGVIGGVLFCGVVSSYSAFCHCSNVKFLFGQNVYSIKFCGNQSFLLWNSMAGFHFNVCVWFGTSLAIILLHKNLTPRADSSCFRWLWMWASLGELCLRVTSDGLVGFVR